MSHLNLLAFDLGASNGRGILGRFDGKRIALEELHRFENNFSTDGGVSHWSAQGLLGNLKDTFSVCKKRGVAADCFGVDTWGVDYGLLDEKGALLGEPRAYRCATDAEMEAAWGIVTRRTLFERSGIASLNYNTVYQLYRRVAEHNENLARAHTLLLMPDLLGYLLTGEKCSEYTIATTTGLFDPSQRAWDFATIRALGIPERIFTKVDCAGTRRGCLSASVAGELGVARVPFAAVGTHDTASAVAAIPGAGSFAFCSSGTWSLFGVETDAPILTSEVYEAGFSNEGTVQGAFRPLKNIMGLWLIQECRREWLAQGQTLSWNDIVAAAEQAEPLRSVVDPEYADFFAAGDMPGKIRRYCGATGQPVPETVGEIARCIYESLALKYRWALERLCRIKGRGIDSLNITGGGIQNKLLNQMAADSTGMPVITGPIEGAALGNLLMQAVALGELSGIADVRAVVRASVDVQTYEPHRTQAWEDAYARMLRCIEQMSAS